MWQDRTDIPAGRAVYQKRQTPSPAADGMLLNPCRQACAAFPVSGLDFSEVVFLKRLTSGTGAVGMLFIFAHQEPRILVLRGRRFHSLLLGLAVP